MCSSSFQLKFQKLSWDTRRYVHANKIDHVCVCVYPFVIIIAFICAKMDQVQYIISHTISVPSIIGQRFTLRQRSAIRNLKLTLCLVTENLLRITLTFMNTPLICCQKFSLLKFGLFRNNS